MGLVGGGRGETTSPVRLLVDKEASRIAVACW